MAHIDELVSQITDENLRESIMQQVKTLTSRKEFGLVFQRHSPETVILPEQLVRTGDTVVMKDDQQRTRYNVVHAKGEEARIIEINASSEPVEWAESIIVDRYSVVVIKNVRDGIYPGLKLLGEVGENSAERRSHIVIKGENYHALRALEYTHRDKVDLIYIDPPYNTGAADWKYNDKFVDGSDSYRHSKWLSFIEKRLEVAKELLKVSGIVMVSIGHGEHHRLRMLMDQVFGEPNFIASVTRLAGAGSRQYKHIKQTNDYVLIYARSIEHSNPFTEPVDAKYVARFGESDSEGRYRVAALYQSTLESKGREMRYYIECPDGSLCIPPGKSFPPATPLVKMKSETNSDKIWRWSPETFAEKKNLVVFKRTKNSPLLDESGQKSNWNLYVKQYLDVDSGITPTDVWDQYVNRKGAATLKSIGVTFDYSKPVELIQYMCRIINNPDAIIVDFFAGSGTTAEAVMRLNDEDGGNRQSILVTNNELSRDEDKKLRKEGYEPGDAEYERFGVFHHVTMPRISTVLTGIREDGSKFSDGIDGQSAKFYELTYEDENLVSLGNKFEAVAPLLWMQAGCDGTIIEVLHSHATGASGYAVPSDANYAVIFDSDAARDAIEKFHDGIKHVFVVTDSSAEFQSIVQMLPTHLRGNSRKLYSDYLRSFAIRR